MKFQQVVIVASAMLVIAAFGLAQSNGTSDVCGEKTSELSCFSCCWTERYLEYNYNEKSGLCHCFGGQFDPDSKPLKRDHWFNGNYYENADEAEALQKPFEEGDKKLASDRKQLLHDKMMLQYREQQLKETEQSIAAMKGNAQEAYEKAKREVQE